MRLLIAKSLMPAKIDEAKSHLAPLKVGCGVMSGLEDIIQIARDALVKLGGDTTCVSTSVYECNAFNRTSRSEITLQTAEQPQHSPYLIRFEIAPYGKVQPYLRLGDGWRCIQKGTQQLLLIALKAVLLVCSCFPSPSNHRPAHRGGIRPHFASPVRRR